MKKLVLLGLVLVAGCASIAGTGSIVINRPGNMVTFTSSRQAKMTWKEGNKEYIYDSQAPSLLQRIMSAVTLGAMGAGK